MSDTGLITRTFRELKNLSLKRINNPQVNGKMK
jgi:hypothetical protein